MYAMKPTTAPCLTLVIIFAASPLVNAESLADFTLPGISDRFSQSLATILRCASEAGFCLQAAVLNILQMSLSFNL
jgi:hypothetical protein